MQLYLTGSHYFGTAHPYSDVDFYAADSPQARELLERLGFELLEVQAHAGSTFAAVYSRSDARIQVQLVDDVELKARVQQLLRDVGLATDLKNKVLSRRLWQFAYKLAHETRSDDERISSDRHQSAGSDAPGWREGRARYSPHVLCG